MGNTLTHSKKENQCEVPPGAGQGGLAVPEIHTPGNCGDFAGADSAISPASMSTSSCAATPMSPGEEAAAYAELEKLKTPNPSPNVSVWQNTMEEMTPASANSAHIMSLIDPRSPNEDISRTPILIAEGKDGGQPKDLKGLRKKLVTQQAGLVGNPPTPSSSVGLVETPKENADPAKED